MKDKHAGFCMQEKEGFVEIISNNAEQTVAIGYAIGEKSGAGDIFALSGELGTGKTCLTCGLARGIGVGDHYLITSPTFTLVNEYPGRCPLYHFDVYRLNGVGDLDDLGYDEYMAGKGVIVIEWAEKIASALPADVISIHFSYVDENIRIIRISGPKKRIQELIKDMKREV